VDYDNNLTGALFRNDKGDNDRRPDYKGFCEINGQQYWISSWIRDKKDGSGKFMSLRFEAKEQQPAPAPKPPAKKAAAKPVAGDAFADEEIPF
jgi:hypothetical protein